MIVRIRCPLGLFPVTVSDSAQATIGSLKLLLKEAHQIECTDSKLMMGPEVLEDGSLLSQHNIRNGDILNLAGNVKKVDTSSVDNSSVVADANCDAGTIDSNNRSVIVVAGASEMSPTSDLKRHNCGRSPLAPAQTPGSSVATYINSFDDGFIDLDGDVYIMHETQDSSLCGQHCLNNLVQQSVFTTIDLSEIAQELDRLESDFLLDGSSMDSPRSPGSSGNGSKADLTV
jgi:hypothetical protein